MTYFYAKTFSFTLDIWSLMKSTDAMQFGFMSGRGTTNNIFYQKNIFKKLICIFKFEKSFRSSV